MNRQSLKTLAMVSAVVVGTSLIAQASVDMTFTWTGTLYQSGYSADNWSPDDSYNHHLIVSADAIGIYAFTINRDGGTGLTTPFYSVCLDPAGLLDGNQHTYDVKSFGGASPGDYPSAWAWALDSKGVKQYYGINNAAYLWSTFGLSIVNSGGDKAQRAAALEFAIWTALYDSQDYGKLGGSLWTAPTSQMGLATDPHSTLSYYNGYLTSLTSPRALTGALYTGNILEGQGAGSGANSGQSQEFFFLGTPIPEPTTLVGGALLLLPLGASALRKFRKNRAA